MVFVDFSGDVVTGKHKKHKGKSEMTAETILSETTLKAQIEEYARQEFPKNRKKQLKYCRDLSNFWGMKYANLGISYIATMNRIADEYNTKYLTE